MEKIIVNIYKIINDLLINWDTHMRERGKNIKKIIFDKLLMK